MGAIALAGSLMLSLPGQRAPGSIAKHPVEEQGYEDMSYHVFTPAGLRRGQLCPVIFALHGNGQRAEQHIANIAKVSTGDHPVFVIAPQYQKEARFNAPVHPGAGAVFAGLLAKLLAEAPVDPGRVILQGFSMGSNYSTAWIDSLTDRSDPGVTFPFCAIWLNGTAVPPRHEVPSVPFLLFVGEKETAVLGRINVRESVRTAYLSMFRSGLDVRYLEIPGMGHTVNAECHRLMQEHLTTLPDHTDSFPEKLSATFPELRAHCSRGEFAAALEKIEAVLGGEDSTAKSRARTVRNTIVGHVRRMASAATRKKDPEWSDYRILRFMREQTKANSELQSVLRAAIEELEEGPLAEEISAMNVLDEATGLATTEPDKCLVAIRGLANGRLADTFAGRRARAHLQASDETIAYPWAAEPSDARQRKR